MKGFFYVLGIILGVIALWLFIVWVAWLDSLDTGDVFKDQLLPITMAVGGLTLIIACIWGCICAFLKTK